MVLLCRLSPIFPFILLNYFLGLTAVRTALMSWRICSACCRRCFFCVYIGAAARDALEVQPDSHRFLSANSKICGSGGNVLMVVVVTRLARKALREAEQAQERAALSEGARR